MEFQLLPQCLAERMEGWYMRLCSDSPGEVAVWPYFGAEVIGQAVSLYQWDSHDQQCRLLWVHGQSTFSKDQDLAFVLSILELVKSQEFQHHMGVGEAVS